MKLILEVSVDEDKVIQLLEAYGWKAPDNVQVQVNLTPVSNAPAMVPKDGGVGFVQTPINTPVLAPAHTDAGAAVASGATHGGFEEIFKWLIPEEGGYTNDPDDPGGPTMYGIDTKDDRADWTALGVVDVRNLTLDQAKGIYKKKYWDGALCNTMPTPIGEVHFNYAVNCGPEQSIKFMQAALGISVDGQYGPVTKRWLVGAAPEARRLIADGMIGAADKFYHMLAQKPKFVKDEDGWINRNNDLRKLIASW